MVTEIENPLIEEVPNCNHRTKIFYAGTHGGETYSNVDVQEIAHGYNQCLYSAPWVLGHEVCSGMPAAGWVRSLEYEENDGRGELFAISDWTALGLATLAAKTHENKSIGLYPPESPYNPNPGNWSLKHIAALGAEPPVLKELGPISSYNYSEWETPDYYNVLDLELSSSNTYTELSSKEKNMDVDQILREMSDNLQNLTIQVSEIATKVATLEAEEARETADEEAAAAVAKASDPEELGEGATPMKMDKQPDLSQMDKEQMDMVKDEEYSELDKLRKKVAVIEKQLQASQTANVAVGIGRQIEPLYSEGLLTDKIIAQSDLVTLLTKLTVEEKSSNYSEGKDPQTVINLLLKALADSRPQPELGVITDEPSDVNYSEDLNDTVLKAAQQFGLSYVQALDAVTVAKEYSELTKTSYPEALQAEVNKVKK